VSSLWRLPPVLHPPPPSSNRAGGADFPLETSPEPVSLGVLSRGQKAVASFAITNRSERAFAIDRVVTSCPCLVVKPPATVIGPLETKTVAVEFDPTDEPDFVGGLSIDVTGYAHGAIAFRTRANLEVTAERGGDLVTSHEEARP